MLTWVGKRPLTQVTAFPAQLAERHLAQDILGLAGDDPDIYKRRLEMFRKLREYWNADCWEDLPNHVAAPESGGLLLHGDNKECLAWLVANGYRRKVHLVYIDPPFDSGADYVRKVNLRGAKGETRLDAETYSLGEQIQYTDIWANDNYLQFMYERLMLLKELLADTGSIYLHSDSHRTHQLRSLMDEVFGPENFRNDIIWQRFNYRADGLKFGTVHDTILFYTKSAGYTFEKPYVSLKPSYIKTHFKPDHTGRLYRLDNLTAPSHGKQGKPLRFGQTTITPPSGTMWRHAQEGIDELWSKGLIEIPEDGVPQIRRYLDEIEGQAVHSIWTDLSSINSQSDERSDYPTQKPEVLIERILTTSSKVGDLVLDCFVGSGTTAAVAQKMGRRWIGCDINKGAIQTTAKRLRGIVTVQIDSAMSAKRDKAGRLIPEPEGDEPKPCQFGFHVVRVNNYDLQIQHNEAVNLACEHIGVQRTRSDRFFDGTRGTKLVKIVPFDHPLSPVDMEEVRRELEARPDEDRAVIMVSLGIEVAARTWIDDWNRRRGKVVNKIEVIELRTDPKYGRFIQHQPAKARVKIARSKDQVTVEIQDFVSPTIVERLQQQAGVVAPKIDDWRAMVDCVMIDTAYDGNVFNVVLADIPEKKQDYVQGSYNLPAPGADETLVAVKIIDMLGEEVVHTANV